MELVLRGNNRWNGSGKWSARLLQETNASPAQQFESAFLNLYNGSDPLSILQLGDTLLKPHGGRLFAGYRSDAPTAWRSAYIANGTESAKILHERPD